MKKKKKITTMKRTKMLYGMSNEKKYGTVHAREKT
jgi:hypothetical protein